MVLVAVAVRPFLGDQAWLPALLFGAMLAPTDPISVLATLKTAKSTQQTKNTYRGRKFI